MQLSFVFGFVKVQATEVSAIATSTCTSDGWGYNESDITDNMFCAGYFDGTPRDACQVSWCRMLGKCVWLFCVHDQVWVR